jgi:hypothetical protein
MMFRSALLAALCATAAAWGMGSGVPAVPKAADATDRSLSINIENIGTSALGVFFVGNETERRDYFFDNNKPVPQDQYALVDFEVLADVLPPGKFTTHGTHFGHAFEARSRSSPLRCRSASAS